MFNYTFKIAASLLVLVNLVVAGPAKSKWKYGGEDHGIRFYFKSANARAPMKIKVVSTLDLPAEVSFRVKDLDWKRNYVIKLAPGETRTLVYKPTKENLVRYPYFDRVWLNQPRYKTLIAMEAPKAKSNAKKN